MLTFLAVAVLVITESTAQAAALAAERSPAKRLGMGTGVTVAQADPERQTDRPHIAPARCPYQFGSAMPSATFCVYRGVALGSGGEVCATGVVVIWNSVGSPSRVNVEPAQNTSGPNREIYLGFVADPELVLRAIVDSRQGNRAEMVGYTLGRNETPQPLAGETTRRTERLGSSATADVLHMDLWGSRQFRPGSCAFASYSGTFMGVIGPPIETGTSRP